MGTLEFYIAKEGFQQALNIVSRAVTTKPHLPILSGVKLEVTKEQITITCNNMEMAIECVVKAEKLTIIEPGSAVIPAKNLLEIIKKLPDELHVKTSKSQMMIRSEEISVNLPIFPSAEYPNLPVLDKETTITVGSTECSKMIKKTAFAVAKEMSRPTLTGIHFSIMNGELTAVATNSQRLALQRIPVESKHNVSFTVPGSSLNELMKLLQHEQQTIHIHWSKTHIAFCTEKFTFYSNLLEGTYPDPSRLIPEIFKTNITLDKRHLLSGIDRACLFSNEWRNRNVQLEVKGSKIRISSKGTETGRIEEMQPIKELEGDREVRITLDASFLMDTLKVMEGEDVKIRIAGEMKPVVLEPIGDRRSVHLISLVRTN